MTPLKKLETMIYQAEQGIIACRKGDLERAAIWACSIENTAIRWGPEVIKDLATKAYQFCQSRQRIAVLSVFNSIVLELKMLIVLHYPEVVKA